MRVVQIGVTSSENAVVRLPRNFAWWSEVDVVFIHRHLDFPHPTPLYIEGGGKNYAKFNVLPIPRHITLCAVVLSADKFSANKRLPVNLSLRCFPHQRTSILSSRTFCSAKSSSRRFYSAYDVRCSAKRCHLANKNERTVLWGLQWKITKVATPSS